MNKTEYLENAYWTDQMIAGKISQLRCLNDLATKVNSVMSLVPPSGTRNVHELEDTVIKIVDLQREINKDIDCIIDFRRELSIAINKMADPELRSLLTLRYLGFKKWEDVALEMGYSVQHIYRLKKKAIAAVEIKDESKC